MVELVINSDNEIFKTDLDKLGINYRLTMFNDDKEYVGFIKQCVRQVRGSPEYRNFIAYLRGNLNLNRCVVLNKLDTETVQVELHHHCYTLFDIIECVLNYLLSKKMPFNTFLVSYIVMQEHYSNNVGLVPLSSTIHELVHSDGIFIHKDLVIGNHQQFYDNYLPYMPKHLQDKYQLWINKSNERPMDKEIIPILSDGEGRYKHLDNVSNINVSSLNYDVNNKLSTEVMED